MASPSIRFLAIDTSDRIGLAAAGTDRISCVHEYLPANPRSAATLAPAIQNVLVKAGLQPLCLKAIFVVVGPGSFTGLRVGITAAKTMGYAASCNLVPIHTHEWWASSFARQNPDLSEFHIVTDAQKNEFFLTTHQNGNLVLAKPMTSLASLDRLAEILRSGGTVIGPGIRSLEKKLKGSCELRRNWLEFLPSPEDLVEIGLYLLNLGRVASPFELLPDYYRLSYAEEKKS